jgi:ABC-type nickel/cobalt efflux system permease component RcnA
MRRALMLSGLGLGLVAAVVWAMGGAEPLSRWAADQQRAVQDSLAAAVRALRAGTPGAWAGLLTVCFGYGVVHALGPGHGKAVIGAYGMASRVPLLRLSVLALSASLAQAGVAVVLVAAGAALLGWTRPAMERFAETAMLPVSHLLVAALGLWLVLRGAFGLRRQARAGQGGAHLHDHHHHDHDHDHDHDASCGCGHAHGPSPEEMARVGSLRDGLLLIGAVAMRPCSGAIFLLILTFAMGIGAAGVAGAFAMGLGTALVTLGAALASVWLREGALAALPGAALARAVPLIEVMAGGLIILAALALLAA